ncbi:acetate kinase [Streptococcus dentasini]
MIESFSHLVSYYKQQIASRSLSQKLGLDQTITLYAFDKGENISEEVSTGDKLLQVLEGQLLVSLDHQAIQLKKDSLLAIHKGQRLALEACEQSKLLQIDFN